jgi:hypothetical protein
MNVENIPRLLSTETTHYFDEASDTLVSLFSIEVELPDGTRELQMFPPSIRRIEASDSTDSL